MGDEILNPVVLFPARLAHELFVASPQFPVVDELLLGDEEQVALGAHREVHFDLGVAQGGQGHHTLRANPHSQFGHCGQSHRERGRVGTADKYLDLFRTWRQGDRLYTILTEIKLFSNTK